MIEELIAASAIGISLGNAWVCALVSLGVSVESRKAGLAFIAGRFLGLLLLGGLIAGLGLVGTLGPVYFLAVFGALTVALGVVVLLQALGVNVRRTLRHLFLPARFRRGHGGRCTGQPMTDGGEVERMVDTRPGLAYVFVLGLVRGATPCAKMMVLAPLLIASDFPLALGMVLVFAAASTVYPVLGFLSGNILRQSVRRVLLLRLGAAVLMVALGAYFIANAFLGTHGG